VEEFALTFNGYGYFGDAECAVVADRTRRLHGAGLLDLATNAELRNLLFFTQRAVRHQGDGIGENELRMVHEVLAALRDRLLGVLPLADATDDDLRADPETTPLPATWFGAMLDGVFDERQLLAQLLCRVAPEGPVVACACRGLLRLLAPADAWHVRLEAGYPATDSAPAGRADLLVRAVDRAGEPDWVFEWKPLWERGFGECVGGIKKDIAKVRARERGCAMVFAYGVRTAPGRHSASVAREPLDATVGRAVEALGPALRSSRAVSVSANGIEADFRLLAWR
jgi:hypothetical protein